LAAKRPGRIDADEAEAGSQGEGGVAVAEEAEGAEVVEVALASTFGYGADVVGVPEGAAGSDGLHAIETEAGGSGGTAGSFEGVEGSDGVDAADGAKAAVTTEDLVAEVAGVGAETPLVDAVVAAEGAAAFGDYFQIAPATEGQAVRAEGEIGGVGAAAGEGAGDEHAALYDRAKCWCAGLMRQVRGGEPAAFRQASKSSSTGSMRGRSHERSCWWTGWFV
jgi:hypothetical protein